MVVMGTSSYTPASIRVSRAFAFLLTRLNLLSVHVSYRTNGVHHLAAARAYPLGLCY